MVVGAAITPAVLRQRAADIADRALLVLRAADIAAFLTRRAAFAANAVVAFIAALAVADAVGGTAAAAGERAAETGRPVRAALLAAEPS